MNLTPVKKDDWLELHAEGRLDILSSEQFHDKVCDYVKEGFRDIRLDASKVDYVSSAGLRAMLQSHRKLASVGGSFSICNASPFVAQVISMSGLDTLLG